LDEGQRERLRRHTIEGEEMLAGIAGLEHLAAAVRATHEAWDGSGYPDGLQGGEIPLTARIVSVIDSYDAMTSQRAYRRPLTRPEALSRLRSAAGVQIDPRVVGALLGIV
jgi:HD-GYP domain-containing protein (c-di-GMP phosphodiesterase class II)